MSRLNQGLIAVAAIVVWCALNSIVMIQNLVAWQFTILPVMAAKLVLQWIGP